MKATLTYALVAMATLLGLGACSNIDYEGEYSKDGYYESANQVYFYYNTAADTLRSYSFAGKHADTIKHVVYIPVRLTGKVMDRPQTFKVVIDPVSTAKPGTHFTALASEYTIAAGASTAYVPVELLRANLSEVKDDSIKLVLHLAESSDLGIRFAANTKVSIRFDNTLTRPDFWDPLENYFGLGAYSPAKHKKLLSYYDGNPEDIYKALTGEPIDLYYALYYNVQAVVAYFNEHPDEV